MDCFISRILFLEFDPKLRLGRVLESAVFSLIRLVIVVL